MDIQELKALIKSTENKLVEQQAQYNCVDARLLEKLEKLNLLLKTY